MPRWIGLGAIALMLAACTRSDPSQLATAVTPQDIAFAVCTESRPGNEVGCKGTELPTKTSETAYSLCLDYHPGDTRPCKAVREVFEADLRAFFAPQTNRTWASVKPGLPEPPTGSYRQRYATARAMYVATSRDAQTFEAALLIPDVRRKVGAVLGHLDDEKLKALAAQSKAEAIFWYQYMQKLEQTASE